MKEYSIAYSVKTTMATLVHAVIALNPWSLTPSTERADTLRDGLKSPSDIGNTIRYQVVLVWS